jgi:hypothetical protein
MPLWNTNIEGEQPFSLNVFSNHPLPDCSAVSRPYQSVTRGRGNPRNVPWRSNAMHSPDAGIWVLLGEAN